LSADNLNNVGTEPAKDWKIQQGRAREGLLHPNTQT